MPITTRTRRALITGLAKLVVMLVVTVTAVIPIAAQTPTDREDPLSSDTILLRPSAWITGVMTACKPGAAESFGRIVSAFGDINNDRIADFGINRYLCDTMFDDFGVRSYPDELLVYHGLKGSIPSSLDGQRIGPAEIGSATTFLAAGDWDADGYKDLAVRIHFFADSSEGDNSGTDKVNVVIFWGNASKHYSLTDTSRISCGGNNWIRAFGAVSGDFDSDGVDDLVIWGGNYLVAGKSYQTPSLMIFQGHNQKRWGRSGVRWTFDWGYWSPPSFGLMKAIDQDCDGNTDLALCGVGLVSILYGKKGGLPDTANLESVDLTPVGGSHLLLTDLTGDHVPELVVNCFDERTRVYAGNTGQRLLNLFGTGNDPADPDHGRPYPRPWVIMDLPHRLHDGWSSAVDNPIYDFGDMNLDGYRDIWTYSAPFIICYGSGKHLDSKIDAMFDTRDGEGFRSLTWLGDIDGSGYESFAVGDGTSPGTIQFVKLNRQWEIGSDVAHPFPHPDGFICLHDASVVDARHRDAPISLQLSATPNPAHHDVVISWSPPNDKSAATITVIDPSGRMIDHLISLAGASSAVWSPAGVALGLYYVTLKIDSAIATVPVVLD